MFYLAVVYVLYVLLLLFYDLLHEYCVLNSPSLWQWIDSEGKTALIVACMNPQLYNVAKTLIELGANVNVYRPGNCTFPFHCGVS